VALIQQGAHPRHEAPQRCSIELRSGDCGGYFGTVTHCHVQETNLKLFELCDMERYPAGSSHQRMVAIKGWTWSETMLR